MNKKLESYVKFGIECMRGNLDWAVKELKDRELAYRKSFVRNGIKEERDRMLGVLSYLSCYERSISDDEYSKYVELITDEYYKIENKINEVLK